MSGWLVRCLADEINNLDSSFSGVEIKIFLNHRLKLRGKFVREANTKKELGVRGDTLNPISHHR